MGDNQTILSNSKYKEYLQLKATQQALSSATVAHSGNFMACISHSSRLKVIFLKIVT